MTNKELEQLAFNTCYNSYSEEGLGGASILPGTEAAYQEGFRKAIQLVYYTAKDLHHSEQPYSIKEVLEPFTDFFPKP